MLYPSNQSYFISKRTIQRWISVYMSPLQWCYQFEEHHSCTVDIVLEINVGISRTRYSYQPTKECRHKKKDRPNQSSISKRVNHTMTKSLLRANPSPHNGVISTKPLLAYLSQNLASRGYEKCLDTLKIGPTRPIKMSTTHPPLKSTPTPASNHQNGHSV